MRGTAGRSGGGGVTFFRHQRERIVLCTRVCHFHTHIRHLLAQVVVYRDFFRPILCEAVIRTRPILPTSTPTTLIPLSGVSGTNFELDQIPTPESPISTRPARRERRVNGGIIACTLHDYTNLSCAQQGHTGEPAVVNRVHCNKRVEK